MRAYFLIDSLRTGIDQMWHFVILCSDISDLSEMSGCGVRNVSDEGKPRGTDGPLQRVRPCHAADLYNPG